MDETRLQKLIDEQMSQGEFGQDLLNVLKNYPLDRSLEYVLTLHDRLRPVLVATVEAIACDPDE